MDAQEKRELLERGVDTRTNKEIIEALNSRQGRLATMTDQEKADLDRLFKEDEAKYFWMTEDL